MRVQDLQEFLSKFTEAKSDGSRQGNAISNAIIMVEVNGYLEKITFSKKLKKIIYKIYFSKKTGDFVKKFILGKDAIGNIFLKFKNFDYMIKIMKNF